MWFCFLIFFISNFHFFISFVHDRRRQNWFLWSKSISNSLNDVSLNEKRSERKTKTTNEKMTWSLFENVVWISVNSKSMNDAICFERLKYWMWCWVNWNKSKIRHQNCFRKSWIATYKRSKNDWFVVRKKNCAIDDRWKIQWVKKFFEKITSMIEQIVDSIVWSKSRREIILWHNCDQSKNVIHEQTRIVHSDFRFVEKKIDDRFLLIENVWNEQKNLQSQK